MATSTRTTYYRTAAGTHRHARQTCALVHKRNLQLGEVAPIPAAHVAAFPPCSACCTDADQPPAEAAPARCANSGVTKPQRRVSTCKDCGKEGTVRRATGNLLAHAPAA